MLRREVPEAREILRNLIVGRIVFTPRPETRLYEFSGRGSLGRPRGRDGQFSFGGDPGGFHQEYVSAGVVRRGRRGPRRLGSTRGFGQDGGAHRRLQGLRLGTDRSSSQPQFFTWSRNSQSCEPSASDASTVVLEGFEELLWSPRAKCHRFVYCLPGRPLTTRPYSARCVRDPRRQMPPTAR